MRSWCFDSIASEVDGVTTYDREYGSAEFREVMRLLLGNGVYSNPSTNMQVIPANGLNVAVQPGYCWIQGAMGAVDSAESFAIESSAGGRTDIIVARFDLSLSYRSIRLEVIQGTEGTTAVPALTRNDSVYDIQLARVRVRAGATSILQSDITDTRFNSSVCGIVTGVVNQIDATDLFAQFQSVFDEFMTELENTLTGDVAGNLLTLINDHKADTDNPHNVTAKQIGLGNVLNEVQYCASNPVFFTLTKEYSASSSIIEEMLELPVDPASVKFLLVEYYDHYYTVDGTYGAVIVLPDETKTVFYYPRGEVSANKLWAVYVGLNSQGVYVKNEALHDFSSDDATGKLVVIGFM